nr:hypothetical protein [Tanacetum cinerariifolium]
MKSLANNFNEFIEKLSSDMNTSIGPSGWEDPKAREGSIPTVTEVKAVVKPLFASVINEKTPRKVIKIRELRSQEVVNGAFVTLPFEAVEEVNARFSNTLYGYFIGKRLAYPLVENYVKNAWAKYGLRRVQLHEEFFLFQFETKDGMESVMENGPWLIQLVLLILNVQTPNTVLKKDVIKHAPVWVKMHLVPTVAYSEIGLSLITTQIGKPIMLDTYTSNMCLNSLGQSTYAKALIEVATDTKLKESMIIAIPLSNKEGHTFSTVDIEYEWTPPRCETCMIFDHVSDKCPKLPKVVAPAQVTEDGFTVVKKKKTKGKNSQKKQVEGVRLTKPSPNLQYRRVERGETSNAVFKITQNGTKDTNLPNGPNLNIPKEVTKQPTLEPRNAMSALEVVNDSDSEDIDEHLTMEEQTSRRTDGKHGASTPLNVIVENKLSVCAILESHVFDINLDRTCKHIFSHWNWVSNAMACVKGTRIIVGWNQNDVDVTVIHQDDQVMHTRVWLKVDQKDLFCSFVYAHNRSWCLLGDFNTFLFVGDTSTGSSAMDISMRKFKEDGVLKKLDRILANLEFYDGFVGAHAIFKSYWISDHSHMVLNIPTNVKVKPKPFKFYNVLCFNDRFNGVVNEGWAIRVSGFYMFQVVQKLNALKKPLRKLLYDKGNLHTNVSRHRADMDRVQSALDSDPFNVSLREEEVTTVVAFNDALIMEERFLKQKAKIEWLKEGDSNSAYFYKAIKSRVSRSKIDVVTDANGVVFQNEKVSDAFISHYEVFLRKPGNDKSPGPDGYTTAFFKEAWDTVRSDVTYVVREFFVNGRLLKEINHTIIALIPKIKESLKALISPNQSAFVPGRSIADNILLTQEIMHNYHMDHGVLKGKKGSSGRRPSFSLLVRPCYGVTVIIEALDEFQCASGLIPSLPKSTSYFCNVLNFTKLAILEILPFEEGRLPVKYLGVPLVSSRLIFRDCKEIIKKVQNRIHDWKNKSLSITGRLQLIQSILSSMHIFWASVFILPTRVLVDIEQLMRGFLWCQKGVSKGKAKVSWEVVCLPKDEGGLALRRYSLSWNHVVGMAEYPLVASSYSRVFWHNIGDGSRVSLWFDRWCPNGPLSTIVSTRDIFCGGFTLLSTVRDAIRNDSWLWPHEWTVKYPLLNNISVPVLVAGKRDCLEWCDGAAAGQQVSVQVIWNSIRPRDVKVPWFELVWFCKYIPRHAVNLWLIIKRRLKTQDLLRSWDVAAGIGTVCPLCETQPDSHEHLFFTCLFSQQVWSHLNQYAGMRSAGLSMQSIISYLIPPAKKKMTRSVIGKIVVAATAYFVWHESNRRLIKGNKRSIQEIIEYTMTSIRLKLLSYRFKKSNDGVLFARLWDLPEAIFK